MQQWQRVHTHSPLLPLPLHRSVLVGQYSLVLLSMHFQARSDSSQLHPAANRLSAAESRRPIRGGSRRQGAGGGERMKKSACEHSVTVERGALVQPVHCITRATGRATRGGRAYVTGPHQLTLSVLYHRATLTHYQPPVPRRANMAAFVYTEQGMNESGTRVRVRDR